MHINLFIQIGSYALIQGLIRFLLRDRPGASAQVHINEFINLTQYHPVVAVLFYLLFVIVVCKLLWGIWHKPKIVQAGVVGLVIPLIMLYFAFGAVFELRPFLEAYPIIILGFFNGFTKYQG